MLLALLAAISIVPCLQVQETTDLEAHHGLWWDAVEDADSYRVYGRQGGAEEWQLAGETTDTFWPPVRELGQEIEPGIELEFAVTARNETGESEELSNVVRIRWPVVCVAANRADICTCFAECNP